MVAIPWYGMNGMRLLFHVICYHQHSIMVFGSRPGCEIDKTLLWIAYHHSVLTDCPKYFDSEDFGQTLRTTILNFIICSFQENGEFIVVFSKRKILLAGCLITPCLEMRE